MAKTCWAMSSASFAVAQDPVDDRKDLGLIAFDDFAEGRFVALLDAANQGGVRAVLAMIQRRAHSGSSTGERQWQDAAESAHTSRPSSGTRPHVKRFQASSTTPGRAGRESQHIRFAPSCHGIAGRYVVEIEGGGRGDRVTVIRGLAGDVETADGVVDRLRRGAWPFRGRVRGRPGPPPAIPAAEWALGLPPSALSSAQVLPEWKTATPPSIGFPTNGDYPLNFVSHARGSLHSRPC